MATTAIYTTSSFGVEPTLENYFGLDIGDAYEYGLSMSDTDTSLVAKLEWKNPHLRSTILPYIPEDNKGLIKTFERAVIESYKQLPNVSKEKTSSGEVTFSCRDVTVYIVSNLDLKDLIRFSKVNKCCFLATKADIVWRIQLCKLLPQVECKNSNLCTFTPEQQFKIIYKRMVNARNPFVARYNYNTEKYRKLKSQLEETELEFEKAGSQGIIESWRKEMTDLQKGGMDFEAGDVHLMSSPNYHAAQLEDKVMLLRSQISSLVGQDFDGSIESLDPYCFQAKILTAVQITLPDVFNNQEKFDEEIEKAQALANTSSSNNQGFMINDIFDEEIEKAQALANTSPSNSQNSMFNDGVDVDGPEKNV